MSRRPALSRSATAIAASVFADLAGRIDARVRSGADLVELHIGDTYRAASAGARFAGVDETSFDAALYRYGPVGGLAALRRALAARVEANGHGPATIDPERHVLVGCGGTHALFCASRAVLEPGDEVIVAAPYWPLSVGVLRAAGAVPVEVPLTTLLYADPSLDPASVLAAAVTSRTRAIYVTTPNNPDGKVLTTRDVDSIARFAAARDLWILADEVYADYVYDGAHASIARHPEAADRTVSIYSLSKSHALAGARVGFAVGPEDVVAVARRVGTHTVFNVPVAAQRVALAALSEGPAWIEEARRDYRDARDAVLHALEGTGVRASSPQGGCYVFIDFAPVLAGRPLTPFLERAIDHGVLLAPGEAFGAAFASWARLCFTAVPPARLRLGLDRLRAAIAQGPPSAGATRTH